jgi:hypothetical protein
MRMYDSVGLMLRFRQKSHQPEAAVSKSGIAEDAQTVADDRAADTLLEEMKSPLKVRANTGKATAWQDQCARFEVDQALSAAHSS